jgi:tRNA modification GTPase
LLNRIAKREAAIVSPYAGTTRDIIEVHLDLGGLPVTLLDTAGIRQTDDPVEREGVTRARARAAGADLVLWVVDARDPAHLGDAEVGSSAPPTWLIRNKIDVLQRDSSRNESFEQNTTNNERVLHTNKPLRNMVTKRLTDRSELKFNKNEYVFDISAITGDGFDRVLAQLARHAEGFLAGAESALVTRERHRRALEDTLAALRRALAGDLARREDLLAEELRIATRALGRLTGRVDVEDVLDVIFRDFCIGK